MNFKPPALIVLAYCVHFSALSTTAESDKKPVVKSVLMVCSANYAVSPMAEAIFRDLAKKKGVSAEWHCDSAGICARCSDYVNEKAAAKLQQHGIEPENRTCRQLVEDDFNNYDYALAMNREHLRDMRGMALVGSSAKMELLASYDPEGARIIRTPEFWTPKEGYEETFQILNRSCNAFLDQHSTTKAAAATTTMLPKSTRRRK